MMEELAVSAYKLAGRDLPVYDRHQMPGRLFRPGEARSDDDDASRASVDVEGRQVHIIGREALLRNKTAAARPKDIADVARLTNKPKR